jgi:hypothetical protein
MKTCSRFLLYHPLHPLRLCIPHLLHLTNLLMLHIRLYYCLIMVQELVVVLVSSCLMNPLSSPLPCFRRTLLLPWLRRGCPPARLHRPRQVLERQLWGYLRLL